MTPTTKTEAVSDERLAEMLGAWQADSDQARRGHGMNGHEEEIVSVLTELAGRRAANTAVGVKALEWQAIGPPGSDIVADTPFGQYTYSKSGRGWALYFGDDLNSEPDDEQACRTAAQADFNTRILASISPVQEEKPVAEPMGYVSTTTLAYLKAGISSVACSIYAVPVSIHNIPLYTRPASPFSAEVTVTDAAPFKAGDPVTLPGVGECVVKQCFYGVGGWRVIAKGPASPANPKGLYDFPDGMAEDSRPAAIAPERLWLSAADADNEHEVWFDDSEGGTPYLRADLALPDIEAIIDAVIEVERYAPKVVPMGANPPLFDGMQPDNDGPWVSRVAVAKALRAASAALSTQGREAE